MKRSSLLVLSVAAALAACPPEAPPPEPTPAPAAETRTVVLGEASVTLRTLQGSILLPVAGIEPSDLVVSTVWGSAAVAPDGRFAVELADAAVGLVAIADAAGAPVASVVVARHPLLDDVAIEIDASLIATSLAWQASPLALSHPLLVSLVQDRLAQMPALVSAADALAAGLATRADFLASPDAALLEALAALTDEHLDDLRAIADTLNLPDPFLAPGARNVDEDTEIPGSFEPIEPGASQDRVRVTAALSGAELDLSFRSLAGRWTVAMLPGELTAYLPPTVFQVPNPGQFAIDTAGFFLANASEQFLAIFRGGDAQEDPIDEIATFVADQFVDAGEVDVPPITLAAPYADTLSVHGFGCAGACPEPSSDAPWVLAGSLTVLTQVGLPLLKVVGNLAGDFLPDNDEVLQCVEDLDDVIAQGQDVALALSAAHQAYEAGLLQLSGQLLADATIALLNEDAIWTCMGLDAFWTVDYWRTFLREQLDTLIPNALLASWNLAVSGTNAGISVISVFTSAAGTVPQADYAVTFVDPGDDDDDDDDDDSVGDDDDSAGDDDDSVGDDDDSAGDDDDSVGDDDDDAAPTWPSLAGADVLVDGAAAGDFFGADACVLGDLDGDGLGEVVVGAPGAGGGLGQIHLFTGAQIIAGSTLSAGQASSTWAEIGLSAQRLGWPLLCGLDVDADGLPDVAVAAPIAPSGPNSNAGRVRIVTGAQLLAGSGSMSSAAVSIFPAAGSDRVGSSLALANLDLDGVPDLIIGAPATAGGTDPGRVFVVLGSQLAASSFVQTGAAFAEFVGVAGDGAGTALAVLPDLDGDGRDEVAIGAPGASGGGAVHILTGATLAGGGALGPGDGATITLSGSSDLGAALVALGDINGDGLSELVLPDPGVGASGGAWIVGGAALAAPPGSWTTIGTIEDDLGTGLGDHARPAGDVDGDGLADVVLASSRYPGTAAAPAAHLLLSADLSAGTVPLSAAAESWIGSPGTWLGTQRAASGDIDGDGLADLVLGASGANADAGAVYVLFSPW